MKKPVHPLTPVGIAILAIYLAYANQRMSLAIEGLILAIGSGWTWTHRNQIWKQYKKRYKKPKSALADALNRPRDIFYTINVWIALPLLFVLGLLSLYAAWMLV